MSHIALELPFFSFAFPSETPDTLTLCVNNKPPLVRYTVSPSHQLQCHTARLLLEALQLVHTNPGARGNSAHPYQLYPCKPFSIVQHAYPLLPRILNVSIAMRKPMNIRTPV